MTLAADGNVTSILAGFGGDPQKAEGLAEFLGFEPIPNPEDRLAGPLSGGLKEFLRGRSDGGFGVSELYRVGKSQGRSGRGWPVGRRVIRLGLSVIRPGPLAPAHHSRFGGARTR